MRLLRVATCNLNQWAMDFDTNLRNVKDSITRAKAAGAAIRVGPELELTGYGCEDHFLEQDTTAHASMAAETCEELFTPNAPRIDLALNGVEVFMNASGSHHQLRKLNLRIDSIRNATRLCGGVYMYANHQGCDGGRLYYDGCCCIAVNGDVVAQGSQFSLKDVEVLDALVDLDAVSSYRASVSSFREQASHRTNVPFVKVPYKLCQSFRSGMVLTSPVEIMYHCPEEEIAFGPSCWLWDYLRRSQASGFLLPLSGGADSSSVAAIVGCMCQLVIKDIEKGDEQVKVDALRIGQYKGGEIPTDSREFAERLFYTVYMGTENRLCAL
ncbi:hypothetical protein PR202_ga25546 [Eleusine coracana subsp. coracana]|uniref:NAD(+) synthase [glutamine-hydrolyzing] n=1 Tax=Eleusine coracana subsp. coracana TaxID=191504 RepID=A0AAV5D9J7_ELECO|nr:hypothetical protein PR202_ga25546 [Eleusine coracana subsp. coracana]